MAKRPVITPDEIRELMRLNDWKQADLAAVIGISYVTVWRWLTKEKKKQRAVPYPTQLLLRDWLNKARQGELYVDDAEKVIPISA